MRSIGNSGVGNCPFLRARGWGLDHQERKNCKSPGLCPGGMITGQIEPYISTYWRLISYPDVTLSYAEKWVAGDLDKRLVGGCSKIY